MRGRVESIASVILVACAIAVTGAFVHREFQRPNSVKAQGAPFEEVSDWRSIAAVGHRTGPADAKVVIVNMSDFQCPFCKKLHEVEKKLLAAHAGQLAVVHRNFPLERIHPYAMMAAIGAECARRQDRYDEFADALYLSQDSIGRASWQRFAKHALVPDLGGFDRCMSDSARIKPKIEDDAAGILRLKPRGTPTVLVNQWLFRSAPTEKALEAVIQAVLQGKSPLP